LTRLSWRNVPEARSLRIGTPDHAGVLLRLSPDQIRRGDVPWPVNVARLPGVIEWSLLDAGGELVQHASFTVLDVRASDSLRVWYSHQARMRFEPAEREFGARLLGAADHTYAW